eukprot:CAMPEP_0174260614 /NCGR_PEP_ID=MMETSP0439-20130205/10073_1 /TAXON_ID=0 /ORGANISM="Stereomyxa ramosa, Strain Chinc5" /LENGTH=476 /DNA_ID=CAMNT_0015344893 /DNA_START=46 /DNA_END=1476 /DNA_ORIENTATION=+
MDLTKILSYLRPEPNTATRYVFRCGHWVIASMKEMKGETTFDDIKFFYANQIDYLRILMCLAAAVTITTDWHATSAFLILVSTLLDWLDGPVARAMNQCSIMGSGWDWCADILCQVVMSIWWGMFNPSVFPVLFLFIAIELTNCIFDFATTATSKYPALGEKQKGFFWVLQISLGQNNYHSFFYTSQWLAFPFYCVGMVLESAWNCPPGCSSLLAFMFLLNRVVLFPLALLYCWCETAYCIHIIYSWTEPARKERNIPLTDDTLTCALGGGATFGTVDKKAQNLLLQVYDEVSSRKSRVCQCSAQFCKECEKEDERQVSRVNIFEKDIGKCWKDPERDELHSWVKEAVEGYWLEKVELVSYGFVTNPVGSMNESFHVETGLSSIYIPINTVLLEEYVVVPLETPQVLLDDALVDVDNVNIQSFLNYAKGGLGYTVNQPHLPPFSVLKLDFDTIHRSLGNDTSKPEVAFCVSVKKLS